MHEGKDVKKVVDAKAVMEADVCRLEGTLRSHFAILLLDLFM